MGAFRTLGEASSFYGEALSNPDASAGCPGRSCWPDRPLSGCGTGPSPSFGARFVHHQVLHAVHGALIAVRLRRLVEHPGCRPFTGFFEAFLSVPLHRAGGQGVGADHDHGPRRRGSAPCASIEEIDRDEVIGVQ